MEAELFHADGQKDGRTESNTRFSQVLRKRLVRVVSN